MAFWDFIKGAKEKAHWDNWDQKPKALKAWGLAPADGLVKLEFCLPELADKEETLAAKTYVEALGLEWVRLQSKEVLNHLSRWQVLARSSKSLSLGSLVERPFKKEGILPPGPPYNLGALTLGEKDSFALERLLSRGGIQGERGLEAQAGLKVFTFRRLKSPEPLLGKFMKLKLKALLISASQEEKKVQDQALKKALEEIKGSKTSLNKVRLFALAWNLDPKDAKKWGYEEGFDQRTKPSEITKTLMGC